MVVQYYKQKGSCHLPSWGVVLRVLPRIPHGEQSIQVHQGIIETPNVVWRADCWILANSYDSLSTTEG